MWFKYATRCLECKSFTVISIASLLIYENKYYVQVYLDNCVIKLYSSKWYVYLDDNLFETDID